MDVACTTLGFTRLPLPEALRRMAEFEFQKVELAVADDGPHAPLDRVIDAPETVVADLKQGPPLEVCALSLRTARRGDEELAAVEAVAELGRQLSAAILTVDAAPMPAEDGPDPDEVLAADADRLKRLVAAVALHGGVLLVATKAGTLTQDPATAVRLCQAVPNLGLTLDPSHFINGPHQGAGFEAVYPHVRHVWLRDTGKAVGEFQVQLGRGEVDYSKIIQILERQHFDGTLTVAVEDALASDYETDREVRNLRRVLESLL